MKTETFYLLDFDDPFVFRKHSNENNKDAKKGVYSEGQILFNCLSPLLFLFFFFFVDFCSPLCYTRQRTSNIRLLTH